MNKIQKARIKANMSQEELARKIGVERSTISKWETSVCLPRAELLPKIAKILNCSVDDLLKTNK